MGSLLFPWRCCGVAAAGSQFWDWHTAGTGLRHTGGPTQITSALARLTGMSSLWILLQLISWDYQTVASCRDCHAELSKEGKLDTNRCNGTGSIQCSIGKKHLHQWLISTTGGEQFPDNPFYGHFQSVSLANTLPLESQSMWVM